MNGDSLSLATTGLLIGPATADMAQWLLRPLSGAAQHRIDPWAYWHARAMVAAWAVLLPLGALIARFGKVTRRQPWPQELDNKFWWRSHLVLQGGGMALCAFGLALAWGRANGASALAQWHTGAGLAVALLGALQIAGGFARGSKGGPGAAVLRGDHYDMSLRRRVFERVHKSLGWFALLLAAPAIGAGLVVADAPRWMALVLGGWFALLAAAFALLQRKGRAIDTYWAIWGPSPAHPGNQIDPIGWGVVRPPARD